MAHVNPPRLLGDMLRYSKHHGLTFQEAWAMAIPEVLLAIPGVGPREKWAATLKETKNSWREAYLDLGERIDLSVTDSDRAIPRTGRIGVVA